MRVLTVVLMMAVGVSSLACGGMSPSAALEYKANMTEPWKTMAMPWGDGSCIASTDKAVTMQYEGDKKDELFASYTGWLASDGWSMSVKDGASRSASYKKDGATMEVKVLGTADKTTVLVFRK